MIMKKFLLLFIIAFTAGYSDAQWQQTSLNNSTKCLISDGTNIFAGSISNGVFKSSDNGVNWVAMNNGIPNNPPEITSLVICGTNIFAAIFGAGVYLSTDSGGHWNPVNTGLLNTDVTALAVMGSKIFASTNGYYVFLTTNNGGNWTLMNNGITFSGVYSLAVSGSKIIAGSLGEVYCSTDTGTTWTVLGSGLPPNSAVYSLVINGTDIFAGTNSSQGIYMLSGNTWTAINNGIQIYGLDISSIAISGNNIFAGTSNSGGYGLGVFLSTNNGSSWTAINSGLTAGCINSLSIIDSIIFAGVYDINTSTQGLWKRQLSQLVGIEETKNSESNIVVFPNPTKDRISIEIKRLNAIKDNVILISDVEGQKILEQTLQKEKTDFDLSWLAKGIYIIKVINNERTEVRKFIKK